MSKITLIFSSGNSKFLLTLFFKDYKNTLKMHDFAFNISPAGEDITVNLGTRDFLLPFIQKISKILAYKI